MEGRKGRTGRVDTVYLIFHYLLVFYLKKNLDEKLVGYGWGTLNLTFEYSYFNVTGIKKKTSITYKRMFFKFLYIYSFIPIKDLIYDSYTNIPFYS